MIFCSHWSFINYNKYFDNMQQKQLNVILFEDLQPIPRNTANFTNNGGTRNLNELFKELGEINRRILKIQIQEQSIQDKVHSLSRHSKPSSDRHSGNNIQEVLAYLEQKLQVLISQSEQAIEEIKEEVERVLTRQVLSRKMRKFQNNEDVNKIQKLYQQKLKLAQDAFNNQLSGIVKKNQTVQQSFEQRIQQIQQKFTSKMKEMSSNQQRLKDKIQQQEKQLRILKDSLKNSNTITKMIPNKKIEDSSNQIRPQLMDVRVIKNQPKQNVIDDDKDGHSRIRRNKIFERKADKGDEHSVSPIKTVYSDFASMKVLNKDLDRFEDFKQHDLDGSDEDVFFYPESNKQKQSVPILSSLLAPVTNGFRVYEQNVSPIVFSPFDVN